MLDSTRKHSAQGASPHLSFRRLDKRLLGDSQRRSVLHHASAFSHGVSPCVARATAAQDPHGTAATAPPTPPSACPPAPTAESSDRTPEAQPPAGRASGRLALARASSAGRPPKRLPSGRGWRGPGSRLLRP